MVLIIFLDEVSSLPDNDNILCNVSQDNSHINVTCDFNDTDMMDSDITGYQVIVQSSDTNTLMVKQFDVNSSNSSVIFGALNDGSHSVIVFPIMDDEGISEDEISKPVHREIINVTGAPSTTTSSTTTIISTTSPAATSPDTSSSSPTDGT